MKALEPIIRKVFFYGAFVLLVVAAVEKAANVFKTSLLKPYTPHDLLEWAAIALIFAIALQLDRIRLLLGSKAGEPTK